MPFSEQVKTALDAPLSTKNVKKNPRGYSYVEGWHVIAEANRIFGFDGWSRQTIEIKCVSEKERAIGKDKAAGWGVSYIAKVRLCVGDIIREGCGTGHGIDRDLGQAHESALKEAETDAMKRGFMTFGNPFGLALYDKTQENVADEPRLRDTFMADRIARIAAFKVWPDLIDWWDSAEEKTARRAAIDQPDVDILKKLVMDRRKELTPQPKLTNVSAG